LIAGRYPEQSLIRIAAANNGYALPHAMIDLRCPTFALMAMIQGLSTAQAQSDSLMAAGTDTTAIDTVRSPRVDPEHSAFRGSLEFGGVYGSLPFVSTTTSLWNGFVKGRVGTDLFGLPIGLEFDLGTDAPQRGQRNTLRLVFEPQRIVERDRWADAAAMNRLSELQDSLLRVKSGLLRTIEGSTAQLAALQELDPTPPPLPRDSLNLGQPTIDFPADSLPSSPSVPALPDADSIAIALSSAEQALSAVQAQLDEVERQRQLAKALSQVHGRAAARGGRFMQGFRRFELGTCSPRGTEFLLNGTTFQGVSVEYAHKDLFLAIDHGRSFDDAWMNTDPLLRQLQDLQQSLFLADAEDLNPKRLTAVRGGFGAAEGTHLHVGYLNGRKEDLPPGVWSSNTSTNTLTNHVVELNGAMELARGHSLRGAVARSIVEAPLTNESGGVDRPNAGDLFKAEGPAQNAMSLGWNSSFQRIGTQLDLSVRQVDDHFQSYGVAFLRTGSRAFDGRVDQRLSDKLRLRVRYTYEERKFPGADAMRPGTLERAQGMLTYRPTRALGLRLSYLPVTTTAWAGDSSVTDNNSMTGGGASWRKRFGETVATVDADVSRFAGTTLTGQEQDAWNTMFNLLCRREGRWSLGASWTQLTSRLADSTTATSNLSVRGDLHTRKGLTLLGTVQWPSTGGWGGSIGLAQRLTEHWSVKARAEHYARPDLLGMDTPSTTEPAAITLSFTHTW
jgi:hypothetical protein